MKQIRISDEVWAEIAKKGAFGESEDIVLRRVFGLDAETRSESKKAKGAAAAAWGRKTADSIALSLGAKSINPVANEYRLGEEQVTIRCAGVKTNSVGVTFKMLDRVDGVIAALEKESNQFDLYRLSPSDYRSAMRDTKSKGPSAGRVGIVMTKIFETKGIFLGQFSTN